VTQQAGVSKIGVAYPTPSPEALVDADLDTLVTALYVKIGSDPRAGAAPRAVPQTAWFAPALAGADWAAAI
jgi:hypothetical protein